MEPVNKEETRKLTMAEWRERNKEVIAEAMKKYEVIACACGGEIQRLGQTRHFKTKMHINFLQQQEELDMQQEVEDIKEQEIRDNNAEVETWKAEDLQREKEKAEEDARLDAEFEIWNEAQQACRLGYKSRAEKASSCSGNFGRFRSDYGDRTK